MIKQQMSYRKLIPEYITFSFFLTIYSILLFLYFLFLAQYVNKSDSTLKIISNSEGSQNLKLEFQSLTLETNIQDNC